jgi:BMFP domain-containing protein YqiC
MKERGRFMDDLAGVAQGAFSAFTGLRDEAEAVFTARVEAVIHKLDIARGEQLAAVQELAANTRLALETAEAEILALKARVAALEGGKPTEKTEEKPVVDPITSFPQDLPPAAPSDLPISDLPRDASNDAHGSAPGTPIA